MSLRGTTRTGFSAAFTTRLFRGASVGAKHPNWTSRASPRRQFPGLEDTLRVTSFAECNDRLYASVGQQIYERTDGATPQWRLIYTNPNPGRSESGLRGLTAIPGPAGQG